MDIDLMYCIGRGRAANMSDQDLTGAIFQIRSKIREIKVHGLKSLGIDQEKYMEFMPEDDILDVAIRELRTALLPFEDEWQERHKN